VISLIALCAIGLQEPSCKVTALPVQEGVRVGKPIEIALQFDIEPGWHIYWKNPGDSGEPTTIKWNLLEGWKEIDVRFPTPHAIDAGGVVNYGFENKVTLVSRLRPPANFSGDAVNLTGEASYLICKEACVPGSRKFSVSWPAEPIEPNTWREALFALPKTYGRPLTSAYADGKLTISFPEKQVTKAYFFASNGNVVNHSAAQSLTSTDSGYDLTVPLSEFSTSKPAKVEGVLALTIGGISRGYDVSLTPKSNSR
jgi:thiol:disulfide interchange protein DsbD